MKRVEIDLLKSNSVNNSYQELYIYALIVGTGGINSEFTRQALQTLGTSNVKHTVILCDPDTISESNLRNQIFLAEEVGLKKADVLAERYAEAYGVNIFSYSENYLEKVSDFTRLFDKSYMNTHEITSSVRLLPVIVAGVDNVYTRQVLNSVFEIMPNIVYIDAGNESTIVPNDWRTRPKNYWFSEELEAYNDSGWTGQVVCGVKISSSPSDYMPPLAKVYPEILETFDEIRPSELSCQALAASDPQRTIVNKFSALAALSFWSEIIEDKKITTHQIVYHAKERSMRGIPYMV